MLKCFEKTNILISNNEILFSHIKKYTKDFDFTLLNCFESLRDFKKIDMLIIDFLPQKFQEINIDETIIKDDNINDILKKIYINNILNLTSHRFDHSTNFTKPFAINNLLNYIQEKAKHNSLFIYLNDSFLYDESASKIERGFNSIKLTSKENKILKFMLKKEGYKSNKIELSTKIWGHNHEVDSSTVEYHMYKLKNKLPDNFLIIQGFDYFLNII